MKEYPERWSQIEVIFLDGSIQTYNIKASSGLGRYLAEDAGESGILTLLCGPKTHHIPIANIREWNMTELEGKPK